MNPLYKIFTFWQSLNLMIRIVLGIVIGTTLAIIYPGANGISMLGNLFVGALKSIAPILVGVLVISSVAKAGSGLGPRFKTVISLYLLSTLLAAVLAVFASFIFKVNIVLANVKQSSESAPEGLSEVFSKIFQDIMTNPISAISNGNYLSILFWAVIIGLALKIVASEKTINIFGDISDAISKVVSWIIQCAPFGILGLVYTSVSESGLDIFTTYGKLLALLVSCMVAVPMLIHPLLIGLTIKKNPFPLIWTCLKESGVSAFFTRSSAANIPVNMELCKRMGIDRDFYSVSIPLGSTINMNGAAITITIMTLATCYTQGIAPSLGSALLLSILATLGACGASGVAGGSLLLIPMACSLFGISNDISMQVVAVGLIIGVIQDSVETAINSSGDAMYTIAAELRERQK